MFLQVDEMSFDRESVLMHSWGHSVIDSDWVYFDKDSHMHAYYGHHLDENEWAWPTIRVVREPSEYDDYPDEIHYECKQCGEELYPEFQHTGPESFEVGGALHWTAQGHYEIRPPIDIGQQVTIFTATEEGFIIGRAQPTHMSSRVNVNWQVQFQGTGMPYLIHEDLEELEGLWRMKGRMDR